MQKDNGYFEYAEAGALGALGLVLAGAYDPTLLFKAVGACMTVGAGYYLLNDLPTSFTEKMREVFRAVSFKNKDDKYPVKLNKGKSDTHLVYELPPGR